MTDERRAWLSIVRAARAHFERGGTRLDRAQYASGVADALVSASPDLAGKLVAHLTGLAHEPQEWWRGHLRKALLLELLRRPMDRAEPTTGALESLGGDQDLAMLAQQRKDAVDRGEMGTTSLDEMIAEFAPGLRSAPIKDTPPEHDEDPWRLLRQALRDGRVSIIHNPGPRRLSPALRRAVEAGAKPIDLVRALGEPDAERLRPYVLRMIAVVEDAGGEVLDVWTEYGAPEIRFRLDDERDWLRVRRELVAIQQEVPYA